VNGLMKAGCRRQHERQNDSHATSHCVSWMGKACNLAAAHVLSTL
jgi:hypothetical protein